jgi:hypothetical protein
MASNPADLPQNLDISSGIPSGPVNLDIFGNTPTVTGPANLDIFGNTPTVTGPAKIRNIIQTVQEREIVKTAPDLVVMIDGASYLENGYVHPQDGSTTPYALVHFNEHVIGFSAGYDTDQLVPQCSINLSVPNAQKYLYQTIGGNNLLKTMDELVVFAKGYWLSPKGNSLYHRVFKGLIKSVSHTDNGKTLDITITGIGILHFLQLMQMELCPPIQTNAMSSTEFMVTNQANLTPYEMIAATFREKDLLQGFNAMTSNYNWGFNGGIGNPSQSVWANAINAGYIEKWQAILLNLDQDVHVYGLQPPNPNESTLQRFPPSTDRSKEAMSHLFANTVVTENDQIEKTIFLDSIREHLPELTTGNIEPFQGRMTNRLDRLHAIINMIGFEGYQDVNGSVIVKPPLYNLDCTNLDNVGDPVVEPSTPVSASNLTAVNNPFIILLSEILPNESEVEDENGVVCTRMQVVGSYEPSQAFVDVDLNLKTSGDFIDPDKLSRFGLREQPPKQCGWVHFDDRNFLFAVACWELQKANKGWRTYTCTIPLRPELKLGFPVFLPHKDMYGYVKSIQHSYQYGGTATTTVTLDAIRKRPMYPASTVQNSQNGDGATGPTTYYSAQPNLVHQMTDTSSATSASGQVGIPGSNPEVAYTGNATTIPTVTSDPANLVNGSTDQARLQAYKAATLQKWTGMPYDTPGRSYRVQMNPIFDTKRPVDAVYFKILTGNLTTGTAAGNSSMIPYTDSKGYEVIPPFPWGRYTSLRKALNVCCQGSSISNSQVGKVPNAVGTLNAAQSFLFSGVGTPPNSSAGDSMQSVASTIASLVNDDSVFELTYTDATTAADQSTKQQQSLVSDLETSINAKAQLMVSGLPTNSNLVKVLSQIGSSTTQVTGSTISDDLKQLNAGFKNFTS